MGDNWDQCPDETLAYLEREYRAWRDDLAAGRGPEGDAALWNVDTIYARIRQEQERRKVAHGKKRYSRTLADAT